MSIKKFILICGTFCLLSTAKAAPTLLTCIRDGGNGHNFSVEFDENQKAVKTVFGESEADISKSKIVFNASTKEGVPYLFIIHRATGRMEVWNDSTKTQLTPYACAVAKQKF